MTIEAKHVAIQMQNSAREVLRRLPTRQKADEVFKGFVDGLGAMYQALCDKRAADWGDAAKKAKAAKEKASA